MPVETASFISGLNSANPTATDPISEGDNHIRLLKSVLKNTFPNLNVAMNASAAELNRLVGLTAQASDLNKLAGIATTSADLAAIAGIASGGGGLVRPGMIMMWSGSVASIPSGWALCDGTNGTPDLRNRFIVGAGDAYAVAATGGQNAITQVPAHTHGPGNLANTSAGSHSHTGTTSTDPGHQHTQFGQNSSGNSNNVQHATGGSQALGFPGNALLTGSAGAHSHTFTTAESGAHTHTITGETASAGAASVDVRPPYYALCLIMKL